jgi:hypothetical protein
MGDQTQAYDIFQTPLSSGYPLSLILEGYSTGSLQFPSFEIDVTVSKRFQNRQGLIIFDIFLFIPFSLSYSSRGFNLSIIQVKIKSRI